MALADDIRAEIAKIERRIDELKDVVKKNVKTRDVYQPALTELRELAVRHKALQKNLAKTLAGAPDGS